MADEATMVNDGWRLSATLRVVDVPDAVDYGVFLGVSLGNNRRILQFGSDSDGNTLMKAALDPVSTGPEFTLSAGFHDYLLEYDPSTYQLALSVDGNVLMQNFYGFPETRAPVVQWGAGATAHTGQGNWAYVGLESGPFDSDGSVPVPGSALLLIGALPLLGRIRFLRG